MITDVPKVTFILGHGYKSSKFRIENGENGRHNSAKDSRSILRSHSLQEFILQSWYRKSNIQISKKKNKTVNADYLAN